MNLATNAPNIASYADVPIGLATMVVLICTENRVWVGDARSNRKTDRLVAVRQIIATQARAAGYSYPTIGRALNRDHSTIMYAVGAAKTKSGTKANEPIAPNQS